MFKKKSKEPTGLKQKVIFGKAESVKMLEIPHGLRKDNIRGVAISTTSNPQYLTGHRLTGRDLIVHFSADTHSNVYAVIFYVEAD